MPFMHHSYAELRRALADAQARGDDRAAALLQINLARTRLLPSSGRFVLVNTAAQRLLYDNGQWSTERVVVGKRSIRRDDGGRSASHVTHIGTSRRSPPSGCAQMVKHGRYLTRRARSSFRLDDQAVPATSNMNVEAVCGGRIQVRTGRIRPAKPWPDEVHVPILRHLPARKRRQGMLNEAERRQRRCGGEERARLAKGLWQAAEIKTEARAADQSRQTLPVYLAYCGGPAAINRFTKTFNGTDRAQPLRCQ